MIPARIDPSVAIRIHLNSGRSPLASFTSNPWVTSDLAVDQYHFHRRRNQKRLPVHFSFLSRCVSSQTMRENFDAAPGYALRTGSSEGGKAATPRPLFAAKPITIRQGRNSSAASIKMYDYKTRPHFDFLRGLDFHRIIS